MNDSINEWFSLSQQNYYVSLLNKRVGITRCRAEYFVRLWVYLLVKQQQQLGKPLPKPLTTLNFPDGFVPCTHQEAAELFYGDKDKGSDRAAGMMIDKLVALGLIDKEFDGNSICLRIRSSLPEFQQPAQSTPVTFYPDAFNPRRDAIPVGSLLARIYNWMNKKTTAVPQRIARILRDWAELYPQGMRVLRRTDTNQAVGFYVLYPTARESEDYFFLPPSKSLHLSAATEIDPIKMATPGDRNCTSVYVRSWKIDLPYMQSAQVCQFLEDAQTTLQHMQVDFPNLCDMYTLAIHPSDEQLAAALGFVKMSQDPHLSVYWMYIPVEQFLDLDITQALAVIKFD